MLTTLCILILSAIFFVSGKIRSDIVALCALVALLIFHILTPEEALSGFSNSVVIMMVGLFVVGGAIFQTGLAKMLSSRILKLAGNSELRLFILIMAVTSAIGAFVSNTGTVALMLPIVVSLAASNPHMNASRLLMPLAFASSMGGMMTLIGTPPNLVIQNTLTDAGYPSLSFFSSRRTYLRSRRHHCPAAAQQNLLIQARRRKPHRQAFRKVAQRVSA